MPKKFKTTMRFPGDEGGLKRFLFSLAAISLLVGGYLFYRRISGPDGRTAMLAAWLAAPGEHAGWAVQPGQRCLGSPFQQPTYGYIGFRWGDSFRIGHQHQGLDIFGGAAAGVTPVYAAYAGYLTRLPGWKSAVIIRIPQDPLEPGRQIWTYYAHMADARGESFIDRAFPPGTNEVFVRAGTLLGYQGNYSGTPGSPTGVHLHFSIVLDDGNGGYLNELEIRNTLDPSPYFNLPLKGPEGSLDPPICPQAG